LKSVSGQDYYDVSADLPAGSGAKAYIDAKFNTTMAHISDAGTDHPDQLYISFASAVYINDQPAMTPQVLLRFPILEETGLLISTSWNARSSLWGVVMCKV
jgi:cell division inhibitor SulA